MREEGAEDKWEACRRERMILVEELSELERKHRCTFCSTHGC